VYAALQVAHPDWLRDRKVRTLMQIGLERNASWRRAPRDGFSPRATTTSGCCGSWSLDHHGPAVPGAARHSEERRQALRRAFDATMRDPAFIEDAAKQRLDVAAITGEQIESFLRDAYATPKAVVERAGKILAQSGQ